MNWLRSVFLFFALLLVSAFGPYYQLDFAPSELNGINPDGMNELLAQGLDPEYTFVDSSTLLMQAAARTTGDVVKILLNRGANPNRRDRIGNSAIIYAAMYNPNVSVIEALASASALIDQPNYDGATALFYAAGNNPDPEVTARLITDGANVNHTDSQNLSPLIMAATTPLSNTERDNAAVIWYLLQAGAYPDYTYNGLNALEYAQRNPNLRGTLSVLLLRSALNQKAF